MNELIVERCRVCKCTTNLYDLTFDCNKHILEKLESFVFVECEISCKLPNFLCDKCFQSLENAIEFEKKVKESYKEFKEFLEISENKLKTEIKIEVEPEIDTEIYYDEEVDLDTEEWLQDEELPESPKPVPIKAENEDLAKPAPPSKPKAHKPKKCLICPEVFTELKEYTEHRLTHTQCPVCLKQYTNSKSVFAHHNTAHRDIPEEQLTCHICGQKFKHKKNVLIHIRAFHNKEKNFKCDLCDRAFYEKTHLNHHKATHSDDKPFECDECDMKFRTLVALRTHKKFHHPDENGMVAKVVRKEYVCNVCGKVLRGQSTFKIHQMIHTQHFQYECDVCQKKCKTSTILKIHQMIHTGERPHKCELCPKEFRLWNSLHAHKLTHKKQLEGVSSVTDGYLHECEICSKKFSAACKLKSHQRIHTGEKPYSCVVCLKTFTTSGALSTHKWVHRETEFSCSMCKMTTKYKSSLEKHIKKMHSSIIDDDK